VNQDCEVCGKEQVRYPVRVEKSGIVDAVVWIEDIDHGKAFDFPPSVLDQKGCVYVPHIVLMQPGEVPGTYTLVDHSIFRTERGAAGMLEVEGPEAPEIYTKIK